MTDAVTGTGPHVVSYGYAFPAGWGSWTPGHGVDAVAAELATTLADTDDGRALVRRSVPAVNADALRKGASMRLAVWVPDRTTGEVVAIMDLGIRGFPGDATPEAHLARDVGRDLGRRARLMEYAARRATLPAGEATIEQYVLRLRGERQVQGYLMFQVFPPGAGEAVQLVFNTVHLTLLNAVAEQARVIADSLTVTLGEIPGGRRTVR